MAKKWSSSIQLIANITLFAVENAKVKVDKKKNQFLAFSVEQQYGDDGCCP